jgi:hypothetical protein
MAAGAACENDAFIVVFLKCAEAFALVAAYILYAAAPGEVIQVPLHRFAQATLVALRVSKSSACSILLASMA